ncbi:MAG: hypothetical protein GAK43_00985 [Stenotrophomonas maltophilia]|nr:MAG: hypothetical protein GAK43_00985 [Stenotrophomonas maltophilia]
MMQKQWIIAGGAVVVVVGGYFGLCAYASKQAQKKVEDYAYEHSLDESLSWESVKSSPFGGHITLRGVEFSNPAVRDASLHVDSIELSDMISEDSRTRVRVELKGVAMSPALLGAAQGFGRYTSLGQQAAAFGPLLGSGRRELKPFDMSVYVDVDDGDGTAEAELSMDLPELFAVKFNSSMGNLKDFNRTLRRMSDDVSGQRDQNALMRYAMGSFAGEMQHSLGRAELKSASLEFKDNGAVQRSVALQKRYGVALDPTAGDADKQRDEYFERVTRTFQKNCETSLHDSAPKLVDACEIMVDVMNGKDKGIRLSAEPEDHLRMTDLDRLSAGGTASKRLVERLNAEVSSL